MALAFDGLSWSNFEPEFFDGNRERANQAFLADWFACLIFLGLFACGFFGARQTPTKNWTMGERRVDPGNPTFDQQLWFTLFA
ncbi:hypothetical protein BN2475_940013 [Paraburkholderia ribeironis]|uniref:Uncharacterized protein n=1 Tax=Paraburkholderia ribeironis TaxID=1247936 RepID=A0A1N7SL65_9BURK|nr:hypothetical protein BN2475_940013 [Paraburkholderia ribeironis]